jgi:hypothetical protein
MIDANIKCFIPESAASSASSSRPDDGYDVAETCHQYNKVLLKCIKIQRVVLDSV